MWETSSLCCPGDVHCLHILGCRQRWGRGSQSLHGDGGVRSANVHQYPHTHSSHLHMVTSHPHILIPHTLHPHTLTPSYPHTHSSHLHMLTSHPHILTPHTLHPHTLTPSYPHTHSSHPTTLCPHILIYSHPLSHPHIHPHTLTLRFCVRLRRIRSVSTNFLTWREMLRKLLLTRN